MDMHTLSHTRERLRKTHTHTERVRINSVMTWPILKALGHLIAEDAI